MQNYKKYAIPPAQLIIADVPYNVGKNFYGSNPMWYNGGDNKNGESKLAGKAAFNSDFNFNLYEYFHFCSKMLKKEPKKAGIRGRSSDAPCMIVFCAFEQMQTLIMAAKKHGFVHYIPLVFVKNYSPQVLKANMRVVGATEYANDENGGNVKSMSSGGRSISFGTNETLIDKVLGDRVAQNRLCYDTVCEYLSGTGLLYAGM